MKKLFLLAWWFPVALLMLEGCSKGSSDATEPPVVQTDKYLVSYSGARTMTMADVNAMFSPVQSQYPDVATILPYVKSGARVFTVTYNTTFGTKKLVASGLVCVPDGVGTYPMLSFQNGTNTVYAEAPSLGAYTYTFQLINGFAATGFVIVIPDYLGFGASTSVFHPYLLWEPTVNPILDLFRAVKEMSAKTDIKFKLSNDLYIMGYSQGGLATLQLQKTIETSYSSEFNLKGSGCGAGPYNLALVMQNILSSGTYPQPYYLAYIMKGFKSGGAISNPYSDIFNEPFASRIDGLFNGINSGTAINNQLSTSTMELLTADFRTNYNTSAKFRELRDAMTANSVPAWRIKTPLLLVHGQADQDVTPQTSKQLYDDLVKLDAALPVTYMPLAGLNHGTASAPAIIAFIKQFLTIRGN